MARFSLVQASEMWQTKFACNFQVTAWMESSGHYGMNDSVGGVEAVGDSSEH